MYDEDFDEELEAHGVHEQIPDEDFDGGELGGGELAGEGGFEDEGVIAGGAFGEPLDDDLAAGGEDAQLAWRETYYVLFPKSDRPTMAQVEATIADAGRRFQIENLEADDDGLFQSVLIQSPEDNAALEISYESGDAVVEQSVDLAKTLQKTLESDQLAQLMRSDARLDVMHFERMQAAVGLDAEDEEPEAMGFEALDPATLITIVEALANLTGGLPIDPAAGELLI